MENVKQKIRQLKNDASNLAQLIELGDLYYQISDKLEARHYYKKALTDYPHDVEGYQRMGKLLLLEHRLKEANHYLTRAHDLDPKSVSTLILLIKTHIEWKGYTRAQFFLDQALRIEPDNEELIFLAGLIHFRLFDMYHANLYLDRAMQDEDVDFYPRIQFYRGVVDAQQGYFKSAIDHFRKLQDSNLFAPQNTDKYRILQHNLGYSYYRSGNLEKAEETYLNLLESDVPPLASSYVNLSQVYWIQNKTDEALQALRQANKLDGSSWPWMRELNSYLDGGQDWLKAKIDAIPKERDTGLNIGMYLGCVIPNRYPFIDAASRHVLGSLGVGIAELEGAGCCPAPGVFRSFDIETWLALGARNITIAEEINRNMCIMCNGCYGTLNDINTELQHDKTKRQAVNDHLKSIGKEYKGTIDAEHIVWVLYNDIGIDKIKERIVKKFDYKVAVHYGCHIIKPIHNKPWKDDFETPSFLDELVEITGCKSIDYRDKLMCCGAGGGLRGSEKELSLDFTREKLVNMRKAGIDIIIDCCPFCHLQLDLGQMEVNNIFKDRIDAPFNYPVIYITQLLGLALGIDPYRLGLLKTPQPSGVPPFTPVNPIFTKLIDHLPL